MTRSTASWGPVTVYETRNPNPAVDCVNLLVILFLCVYVYVCLCVSRPPVRRSLYEPLENVFWDSPYNTVHTRVRPVVECATIFQTTPYTQLYVTLWLTPNRQHHVTNRVQHS